MAEFKSCVVPFPLQRSPLHESERSPTPLKLRLNCAASCSAICWTNLLNLTVCSRQICACGSLLTQLWICSMRWSCSIAEPYPRREEVRDEQRCDDLPST